MWARAIVSIFQKIIQSLFAMLVIFSNSMGDWNIPSQPMRPSANGGIWIVDNNGQACCFGGYVLDLQGGVNVLPITGVFVWNAGSIGESRTGNR